MEIRFNYLLLPRMQSMLQRVHVREYIEREETHRSREFHGKIIAHHVGKINL